MKTMETPLIRFESTAGSPSIEIKGIGSQPFDSYVEMEIVFPDILPTIELEATEREMIQLAESSGSFAFLDSKEEDIYNDALKIKE